MTDAPLGVIAGAGRFPLALAEAVTARGGRVFILALKGSADRAVEAYPHAWVGIGQFGAQTRLARAAGCRDLVMIGGLVRPSILATMPDLKGLSVLPRILTLYRGGDDHLLSGVAKLFEAEGFRLRGAQEVAPELIMPDGALGRHAPTPGDVDDIAQARAAIEALGAFDVGQAVVIGEGRIIAVEGAEGTDGLLARCKAMREAGRVTWSGRRGVLVKAPKPHQDRRVDLPAIGPQTVTRAAEAGLRGVAVVAGETLTVDPQAIVAAADASGLFVYGAPARQAGPGAGA